MGRRPAPYAVAVSLSIEALRAQGRSMAVPWWGVPLAIAVVSRLFSLSLLVIGIGLSHSSQVRGDGLTLMDGQWYLDIATTGYHAAGIAAPFGTFHDFAFFPLWPALIALVTRVLPIEPGIVAVVGANVLFCAGAVAFWRLGQRRFGAGAATRGLAFLSFGPAAYIFSLAYSESLFLALAAIALATPVTSRARAVLAAVTQLVRLPGFAISATALATLRAAPRRSLLVLLAAPAAFVAWWCYIAWLTGDPAGYVEGTPSWWAAMGAPAGLFSWRPLWDDAMLRGVVGDVASPLAIVILVAILGAAGLRLWLTAAQRDLGWYCMAVIVPTLLFAHWEQWPRHTVLAIPAFLVLGGWANARGRDVLLVLFAVLQVVFVMQVTYGMMTP